MSIKTTVGDVVHQSIADITQDALFANGIYAINAALVDQHAQDAQVVAHRQMAHLNPHLEIIGGSLSLS